MGQDAGAVSSSQVGRGDAAQAPPQEPQQLREEIDRTREDLGDTVAALAEKSDVKARAKEKISEVRGKVEEKRAELTSRTSGSGSSSEGGAGAAVAQVREKAEQNPLPSAALAAFVGGFVFGRLTKRG